MIKINLALRKQAVAVEGKDRGGAAGGLEAINKEAIIGFFKEPLVRRTLLVIAVGFLATHLLSSFEAEQVDHLNQQYDKLVAENTKAKAELAKTAGFDQLKKQFDADEQLIKTKLQTIQKLLADRQVPPKFLMAISSEIPKQVWISELTQGDQGKVAIKGYSLGFDQVTDFMKALTENEFLSDVKLATSNQGKDPGGVPATIFEFSAKRK